MFKRLFQSKAKKREQMLQHVQTDTDPEDVWKIIGELGEGSFGAVHKVKHSETGELAAAKIIPFDDDEELFDYVVEVDILTELPHDYVVGIKGAYLWKSKLWIVLELCEGGALDDILIDLERGLAEDQIRVITRQMLEGLVFLHSKGVIHRDMKAGNILLCANGRVKLTDFGVSAFCKNGKIQRSSFIGTPYWMAPEVVICENIRDRPYTCSADIWSLGITLIELAETNPPYQDMHPMRVLFKIPKAMPPTLNEPHKWSADFSDFLMKCLMKDPSERPSAEELLKHPFVANATSPKPIRDLLKLARADVVEVIEDLADEQVVEMQQMSLRDMQSIATTGNVSLQSPAFKVTEEAGSDFGFVPKAQEPVATESSTGSTAHLKASDAEDRTNFKTLTRTRTFVNEDGETVTFTTTRVVETSRPHGYTMTRRAMDKGLPGADQEDWAKNRDKEAVLKRDQLRAMRQLQRDEKKEAGELVSRLQAEREQLALAQEKKMLALQKTFEKRIIAHDKQANIEIDKLEKAQTQELAHRAKELKHQFEKESKQLQRDSKRSVREVAAKVKTLPKADRKVKKVEALEELDKTFHDNLVELTQHQERNQQQNLGELRANQRVQMLRFRLQMLSQEHDLLRDRAETIAQFGESQILEKQQMLKHQLKATFWLQKHQVHYRHEKEKDQLEEYHRHKLELLDKKYTSDLKLLPKRHKAEKAQRKKQLKKQLGSSTDGQAQLAEFRTAEDRKYDQLKEQLQEAYTDARQSLLRMMEKEKADMLQAQHSKKRDLLANEKKSLTMLDEKFASELRDYRKQVEESKQELEGQCEQQRLAVEQATN
eukprot:m.32495 g.32495  ORF g.32495 m.32495 type:complete len:827 (+) comp9526_c0_seq2:241-2721(+)